MNQPSPRRYIELLGAGQPVTSNVEIIDHQTAMGETMILGLRLLRDGVSVPAFRRRHAVSIWEAFAPQISKLASLGLVERDEERVRLTRRGTLLANSVCAEFV